MKRCKVTALLVDYSSSDTENEDRSATGASEVVHRPAPHKSSEPPLKKRKLPSLPVSLLPVVPQDDPALHQGRIRTTPHVEGQFIAHIYVSIGLHQHGALTSLIRDVLQHAKETIPTLHSVGCFESNAVEDSGVLQRPELHISLSRPIYLRSHQREDMYRAVQRVAQAHKPFTTSFATFCELRNDEKTRTFLAMEIGAGHQELRALVEALTPALRAIRQQEYYDKPRFHASIGWALLDRPAADESQQCDFPTIPGIPDTLIADLNEIYGSRLTSTKVSVLEVQGITIKIGKEIRSWTFSGS